jgi:hypothetical protein
VSDQNFRVKKGLEVGIGGSVIITSNDGNVGLGTTNPTEKLTVVGDTSITGLVSVGSTINSIGNINLQSDSKIWGFSTDGALTLPQGSVISETSTTTVIAPPTAQPGQSLVIRPTVALWNVNSSGYIVYGQPITIVVNLLNSGYYGTVNYEITGTGVNSTTLGRATTGKVVFTGIGGTEARTVTWTIPANSSISEFTFTLTTVDGTYQSGFPGPDPALYYNFESNGLPAGYYVTVTNNGISSSEANHIHLVAGISSTTDLYLGDDDQYIKIEKNGGNVVVGTSTNTNQWAFSTDGSLTFPSGVSIDTRNGPEFPLIVAPERASISMVGYGTYVPGTSNGGRANLVWQSELWENVTSTSKTASLSVNGYEGKANVRIAVSTEGLSPEASKIWIFDEDGSTIFPGGIGVSFANLPVGSVISGVSSIVANITRANLSSVLEYGDSANLGIGSYGLTYGITGVNYAVYELQIVPSPTLQLGDIIAGAGISVGSAIIGIGTGTYNKVIITDKTFPVGAGVSPIPYDTIINFARLTVNPGLSIATLDNTDITLNAGAGGNIVAHSDILPYTTNVWSLGSPARRFKEIWFGTGTIYVQDETLGNDQALGAKDGNFYIKGGAGLEVGEWILRDNTLQIKDSTRDVYIGSLGATADVIFNRAVRVENAVNRTAFYTDRTGRTQFYPPTIPANDIGGMSIIGSTNGAYQPVINSGGMLHITGNDGAVSRITNDAFGTASFPAYISRAARGTAASPSAIVSGDILSRYSTVGFGTTAFPTGPAATAIEVWAKENFTNTAQGTEYRFHTAPTGTTARTLSATIDSTGLSFVGAGSTINSGITFYDNSRLTYFPRQTSETADKFLKVTNEGGNYVMSWQTPPTIEGAVIYKGLYNVETNTPPLTDATGEAGWQYTVVGVGTTNFGLNGTLSLQDSDLLIHNGTHYDQIPGPRTQINSDWNATTGVSAILNKPNIVNQIIGGTGVSLSPSNGIGTVTINATGTQNLNSVLTNGNTSALGINVGVVSATSYTGNGVNLTGIVTSIVAGTGGISVSGSTGRVTINGTAQVNSDWTSTVGVASILNKPTIPAAQVNSDWTATTGISSILNKPTIVTSIVAGVGVTISPSNGIGTVTINATPSHFISTSTTQASTLTVDFAGPDVIFWQPSANGDRTVTLTNFTANRGVRIFITPHRSQDKFTFTGITTSQCSDNSITYILGGGGAAQASMMIELFSTTNDIGGVWIFAYGGVKG